MIQQGRFLEKTVTVMAIGMMKQTLDPLEVSRLHAPSWNNTPSQLRPARAHVLSQHHSRVLDT